MSAIQLANYYYINQRFIDSLADYYNFDAIFYPNARRLVHFVLNQHYMQMSPSSTSPSDDCYMPFDPALISDDNHQTTSSIVAPSPPHVNAIASAVVRPFMPFTLPPRSNTSSSSRTIRNFRNRLGTISTCDHATTTTVRGADDRASSSVGRCRSRSMFVTNTSWTDRLSNDTSIKSSNIDDHHRMMIEPNVHFHKYCKTAPSSVATGLVKPSMQDAGKFAAIALNRRIQPCERVRPSHNLIRSVVSGVYSIYDGDSQNKMNI